MCSLCCTNGKIIRHYILKLSLTLKIYLPQYVNKTLFEGSVISWGIWWLIWLRHCATSQRIAGLIPSGVREIFHWHNPSSCCLALESAQPLTEMSTRNISWGVKGSWCIGLKTFPPSCAECLEIWEPQPPGTLRASPGLYRECFPF